MRRWILGGLLLGLGAALSASEVSEVSDLTQRAHAWVASLDAEQRRDALYPFDDAERFDLRLAPFGLEGLRRDDMSEAQWQAWLEVLGTTLSPHGLQKAETIVSLEREVRQRDQASLFGSLLGRFTHGEQRYYVAIFGQPGEPGPWGLRLEGHHLSLNWTVSESGALALTPIFMGSEPREVPEGWERGGLRALPDEEDLALALWASLDPQQRRRAELPLRLASGPAGANRSLFLGEGERVDPAAPQGVRRADLRPDQRRRLDALVRAYLANYRADLAASRWQAIEAAGAEDIHFAFAGSLTPGEPGYYRIQGPTLLIEWDDTLEAADHVHTIVRSFEGDFGRDLLAEHYATAH